MVSKHTKPSAKKPSRWYCKERSSYPNIHSLIPKPRKQLEQELERLKEIRK
jgi:hypothetical protein